MDSLEHPQAFRRLRWLARLAFVWALLIIARLLYLQIYRHAEYKELADRQQRRELQILAPRGNIVDRSGQILATSMPVESVCVNPRMIPNPALAADLLSSVLSVNRRTLLERMRVACLNRRGFLWVKRMVTPKEAERLRNYKFDWVDFRHESRRVYPKAALAANLIGGVDHEEKGNAGIELSLEKDLRGTPGIARVLTDVRLRGIESEVEQPPSPGRTVALTIDERIQHVADRELKRAVEVNDCQTGSLAVMDPHNGDILALSTYPTFDPNRRVQSPRDLGARVNHAHSVPFEPGSVFKVITVSAALDSTSLDPDTVIDCGRGAISMFGVTIHDAHPYSSLSMADVLAKSSNVGAIRVGLRVGPEKLLEYVRRFGFGTRTRLPLPGESPGVVRPLNQWTKGSVMYVSMGHEISTTTIQLARACSVIANGGYLMQPRLVLWRQGHGGTPVPEPESRAVRILKPETALTMRQLMERVVLIGTGRAARLAGYSAAGKTGSAQIYDLEAHSFSHRYNASFMGFAPVGNPQIVVVVTLNGASKFGGVVSAPVFREVASAALRITGATRDLPDLVPVEALESNETEMNDLAPAVAGMRPPTPEEEMTAAQTSMYDEGSLADDLVGPRVPDFHGKTLRAVLEQSLALGLPVDIQGNGLARIQYPPAGRILATGERVQVHFAR